MWLVFLMILPRCLGVRRHYPVAIGLSGETSIYYNYYEVKLVIDLNKHMKLEKYNAKFFC